MKKYILFILILIAIFYSSGQTYEEQSLIPDLKRWLPEKPFNGVLASLQISYWGQIVSIEERGYYQFIEFLIRKSAHIVTFGVVAVSIFIITKRYLLSFIITVGIAAIDEYHQSLTGGRTPSIQDVFLDTFGAFLALFIIYLIRYFQLHKKSRLFKQT
ncbi:MAG: VanZ family protein [Firmicutes bacterium]|nr:VanZ family protein [Bacillota bacterium]